MTPDNLQAKQFLEELARATRGDLNAKASMYDVGEALGLDKNAAGRLAEDLIAQGWAEIKTLSGGIALTAEGLQQIPSFAADGPDGRALPSLGKGPLLRNEERPALEALLSAVKERASSLQLDYACLQELVIDIKTLEVQLLSERPKTPVVREILRSMQQLLSRSTAGDLGPRLAAMIGESG